MVCRGRFEDLIEYNTKWHKREKYIVCVSIRNENNNIKEYLVECDDALKLRLDLLECNFDIEINKVPEYISKYKSILFI